MPILPAHTPRPRLVALDMDGTLLDASGNVPEGFWELARRAHEQGMILTPASGRQLATLRAMFHDVDTFIAENGTVVFHEGKVLSTTLIPPSDVAAALDACTTIAAPHTVVLCSPTTAYVLDSWDAAAQEEIAKYYHAVEVVSDLRADVLEQGIDIIKIAILCFTGTEANVLPCMEGLSDAVSVVVSGQVWLDVMAAHAHKGSALHELAAKLGIDTKEVAAFGDYLNDYELLREAGLAIAMDNAHPDLKAIADVIAPANTEHGVLQVLEEFLA